MITGFILEWDSNDLKWWLHNWSIYLFIYLFIYSFIYFFLNLFIYLFFYSYD